MEKLTKRDRKILVLREQRAWYKRLLDAGWKDWEEGDEIKSSDGVIYRVQADGSWARLTPRGYQLRKLNRCVV